MAGRRPGQRDVHRSRRRARRLERRALLVERGLDLALQLVGFAPEGRALVGRRAGDFLEQRGDGAAFATQIPVAQRLEIRVGCCRCELARELRSELFDRRGGHDAVLSAEC